MRFAAEIVPVVGIDTLRLVVCLDEGAPLCLEVVHEKVGVSRHLMDQPRLNVIVGVGKRAELLVVAEIALMGAEFSLVLFDVIQAFHSVVSEVALIFLVTLLGVAEFAQVGRVCPSLAPPVDKGVVVGAVLVIVLALDVTFVNLEDLEIEVFDGAWLTSFLRDGFELIEKLLVLPYTGLLRTLGVRPSGCTHLGERRIHLKVAHGVRSRLLIRASTLLGLLLHVSLVSL